VILTGGETVYSVEVENALCAHPAVQEAAVFGVPDARWGESVRAAVVLRPAGSAAPGDLVAFCRGRIAAYKCPGEVDLLEALPRTGSGKIDKKALRAPFWGERTRPAR
jgi:fatty-acyl-CoA synthase